MEPDEMPKWAEWCFVALRPLFKLLKPFHVTVVYRDGTTKRYRLTGFEDHNDLRFVDSTHSIMRTSFWHRKYSVLCEGSHTLIGDFADIDAAVMFARMTQSTTIRRR